MIAEYKPPITFCVVKKRHHARLFPIHQQDGDRSGNCHAGTVVDSVITHPTEFDFYLQSHGGLQGTSRPTLYHVLLDENRFSSDALQALTFRLCHVYSRCPKSVSIVPPVYYAHLLAYRARHYQSHEFSDANSNSGDGSGADVSFQTSVSLIACALAFYLTFYLAFAWASNVCFFFFAHLDRCLLGQVEELYVLCLEKSSRKHFFPCFHICTLTTLSTVLAHFHFHFHIFFFFA